MNGHAKELEAALALISRLTVSGDAVDIIALAKQKIRLVVADLEKSEEVEE